MDSQVKNHSYYNWDNFNPDAASPTELLGWVSNLSTMDFKYKFSSQTQKEKIVLDLESYCILKRAAMGYREKGYITTAVKFERDCDSIYISLPEELKW